MRLRRFLLAISAVALVACSDSDGASPAPTIAATAAATTAPAPTTVPTTLAGRLAQAYPDPVVDPSPAAWQALLADPTLAGVELTVVEFTAFADDAGRAAYDTFLDALGAATEAHAGHMVGISDVWRNGLELPVGFDGGVVWVASYPTRDAYIDTVLEPAVVAAAEGRRTAVVDPHLLVGVNLVPDTLRQLPPPGSAEGLPHDLVRGKTPAQVVDELLSIYSDGGADPTREALEAMFARADVQTQAVSYLNLYAFSADDTGAAGITEYNTGALPYVLAHGARPKAVFNVAQQLLGSTEWNRVIYVRWPSIEVFTDLRLTPGYIEAQKARVSSSDAYGNLVGIDRADAG
jgi:uncharacterized protein (DUF1330 family)